MVIKCFLSDKRIWSPKEVELIKGIDGKFKTVNKNYVSKLKEDLKETKKIKVHFSDKSKYLINHSFDESFRYCNKVFIIEMICKQKLFYSLDRLFNLYEYHNQKLQEKIAKKKYYLLFSDYVELLLDLLSNEVNKTEVNFSLIKKMGERIMTIENIFNKVKMLEDASEINIALNKILSSEKMEELETLFIEQNPELMEEDELEDENNNTIDEPLISSNNNFENEIEEKKVITTDSGIRVQSNGERKIADFLFKNNISFDYDEQITLEGNERNENGYKTNWIRPDFYLGEFNVVIEYWGMMGDLDYDRDMKKKKRLYKESKTTLIEFKKEDLDDLEIKLTDKLRKMGVNV